MSRKKTKDFLLEIGTEELPPKQITELVSSLANNLEENLKKMMLTYESIKTFSSPQRIAVFISSLIDKQPEQLINLRGPSVEIAFDKNGLPTIAAERFAKTCGAEVSQLNRIKDKKGEVLFYQTVKPGKNTIELLPDAIAKAAKKLSVKRAMFWGDAQGPFARPVHWVLALFAHEIVPIEIFGIKSSNKTFGHRFHHPKAITISNPNNYEKLLQEKGFVVADAEKRKQKILEQVKSLTCDEKTIISEDLLDTSNSLVEWPVILMGAFNERFLKIPQEVLITTLEKHQRCFPIADESGELLPRFIIISNIESKNPNQIIAGNEKVVQARFTDAEYFYNNDLKNVFADNLEKIKTISFQEKLGSLYDKTLRLKTITSFIASKINADANDAKRAAELSKCDLATSMVWEFPELQGTMGYYYASKNENKMVALAIKEQYLPRFSKDQIPETKTGCALALADRLDTLVGFFGINKIPNGDKDPFGLRRAATGVLRIILERKLALDLKEILDKACSTYDSLFENKEEVVAKILDFIYDRLRSIYLEQNRNINVFRAVLACTPTKLIDFIERFEAVDKFIQLPEAETLIEIYKRIKNILDKANSQEKLKFNNALIVETAENSLATILKQERKTVNELYQNKQYFELLERLTNLKNPLGVFFEKVMVMVDDEKIRNNRLALLKTIQQLFTLIADFSYLVSGNNQIKNSSQ